MFNNGCRIMQVKGAELSWESTCDCVRTPDSRSCCAMSSGGDRGRGGWGGGGHHRGQCRDTFTVAKRRGIYFSNPEQKEKENMKVGKKLRWRRKQGSTSSRAVSALPSQHRRQDDFSAFRK